MSHIVRFTVWDLAGRVEPYSQELDRHVNVFFGLNGSGKTSLLKILHSAMDHETANLKRVPFTKAEVTIYSLEYKREFTTVLEKPVRRIRKDQTPLPRSDETVPAIEYEEAVPATKLQWKFKPRPPKGGPVHWQDRYLPTWRLQPHEILAREYRLSHPQLVDEQDWDVFFARSLASIWTSYSNELLTELQSIQAEGLVSILRGIMRPSRSNAKVVKFDVDLAFNRVKAFLDRQGASRVLMSKGNFARLYRTDRHLKKVVDDINSIEQRVEETRAGRNNLEQLIADLFIGPKRVMFSETKISVAGLGGQDIGLESLSSGEKQILQLLIQSLLAQENSLLIDEPEISLHIDWQRRLISALQLLNPKAQYILATHSPEVMAEIADEHIFRL